MRPLRCWAARTLLGEGPGSPAWGRGLRGVQRRAWPQGNVSGYHLAGNRCGLCLSVQLPPPHSPPRAPGTRQTPKRLLGSVGELLLVATGRGGDGFCRGRQIQARSEPVRLWGSGPVSCSELGSPLKSRKNPTPRGWGLLLPPSISWSDSFGLRGDGGWELQINSPPTSGGGFRLGALSHSWWRPSPSQTGTTATASFFGLGLLGSTLEPPVRWVGLAISLGSRGET